MKSHIKRICTLAHSNACVLVVIIWTIILHLSLKRKSCDEWRTIEKRLKRFSKMKWKDTIEPATAGGCCCCWWCWCSVVVVVDGAGCWNCCLSSGRDCNDGCVAVVAAAAAGGIVGVVSRVRCCCCRSCCSCKLIFAIFHIVVVWSSTGSWRRRSLSAYQTLTTQRALWWPTAGTIL